MSDTLANVQSTVDNTPAITTVPTVPTFDNAFARKGKGAKGTYTLTTLGKASSLDNGLTREMSYEHLSGFSLSEALPQIEALFGKVHNLVGAIAETLDNRRRENNGQGDKTAYLIGLFISEGIAIGDLDGGILVKQFTNGVNFNASLGREYTVAEFIDAIKANKAMQRSMTNPAMAPRLVK